MEEPLEKKMNSPRARAGLEIDPSGSDPKK